MAISVLDVCLMMSCSREVGINILEENPSTTLMTEAVCSFETLVPTCHTKIVTSQRAKI
jgi:hypothetical protein